MAPALGVRSAAQAAGLLGSGLLASGLLASGLVPARAWAQTTPAPMAAPSGITAQPLAPPPGAPGQPLAAPLGALSPPQPLGQPLPTVQTPAQPSAPQPTASQPTASQPSMPPPVRTPARVDSTGWPARSIDPGATDPCATGRVRNGSGAAAAARRHCGAESLHTRTAGAAHLAAAGQRGAAGARQGQCAVSDPYHQGRSVGQDGALTIAVRACDVTPPTERQDATAFLDITDSHPDAPSFHGWMLKSDPSVSMLQHPLYDVRVLGCRP